MQIIVFLVVEGHAWSEMEDTKILHFQELSSELLFSSSSQTISPAFSQERRKWSCEFFILLLILFVISLASGKLLLLERSWEGQNYFPTAMQEAEHFSKCLTL